MKKNFLTTCSAPLILLLLFTGCKKEDFPGSTCRLERWQGLDDGYLRTHHYNERGLTDEWHETHPWYGTDQVTTYEYNSHKQLTKAKFYDHDVLQSTIILEYNGRRISKEYWYQGDTQTIEDTVVNTYDAKGQLIKRESFANDYYYIIGYDGEGNQLTGEIFITDGTLLQFEVLAYDKHVRNPDAAIAGLPYAVQYINYTIPKLKFNYYRVGGLDENGNPFLYYELDSVKSTPLEAGPGRYAVYFNTFDNVSQLYNRQIWRYLNCDDDDGEERSKSFSPADITRSSPGKFQRRNVITMQEMKEKVKELRKKKSR